LTSPSVSLSYLKSLCWGGVYFNEQRVQAWRILLEYAPVDKEQSVLVLDFKRSEYTRLLEVLCTPNLMDPYNTACIAADIPRIRVHSDLIHRPEVVESLHRILGLWAIRNSATGYVSGLHDVLGCLAFAFFSDFLVGEADGRHYGSLMDVEADIYWCFTAIIDNFQDFYVPGSPGLQRALIQVEDVLKRKEPALYRHFQELELSLSLFAHGWLTTLFTSSFPAHLTLKLWDSIFSDEHPETSATYITAALILRYKTSLLRADLDEVLAMMSKLPTREWSEEDVLMLASEAYAIQSVFVGSKLLFPIRDAK
jgi:hypothetical protein